MRVMGWLEKNAFEQLYSSASDREEKPAKNSIQ